MVSPSRGGRKEGLRCDKIIAEEDNIKGKKPGEICDDLLLEKDSELGVGVRCGRCKKFYPLEEINRRAAEFKNQKEKGGKKMVSKVEEIMDAAKNLSQPEREELVKGIEVLTKKSRSTEEIYPKKNIAEREGYRVTVMFAGVFKEFSQCRAQQGDPKGYVILEARGKKFKLGGSFFCGDVDIGADFLGRINLENFDRILPRFYAEAEDKNMRLEPSILIPVLAEALSPYSYWARKRLEDLK